MEKLIYSSAVPDILQKALFYFIYNHLYISITMNNSTGYKLTLGLRLTMQAACIRTYEPLNPRNAHVRLRLLVRAFAVTVPRILGAAVAPELAPLAAFPALLLVLCLVLLVDDLHLQAADVQRYRTEPEEGDAAHHGALEQHGWHRQQHQPPQGKQAANVRGATK